MFYRIKITPRAKQDLEDAAINVFARAVVRQRRIPFEIASSEQEITREDALAAFISSERASEGKRNFRHEFGRNK